MYAIKGIYDGETVRFADTVPIKEKYNVLITFLKPIEFNGRSKTGSEEKIAALNRLVGITADNSMTKEVARAKRLARQ